MVILFLYSCYFELLGHIVSRIFGCIPRCCVFLLCNRCVFVKFTLIDPLCPTQSQIEGWDAMRPCVEGLWMTRIPPDYPCRTFTGANEIKRNECDECGEMVEWNLWQGKMRRTGGKPTQTQIRPPRNPYGVTRCELGPAVGSEQLTAFATDPPFVRFADLIFSIHEFFE